MKGLFNPFLRKNSNRINFIEVILFSLLEMSLRIILKYDLSEMIRICKTNGIEIIISGYPIGPHRELQSELPRKNGLAFVDNAASLGTAGI